MDHDSLPNGPISRRHLLWLLGGTAGVAAVARPGLIGAAAGRSSSAPPTEPLSSEPDLAIPTADLSVPPSVPSIADLAAELNWDIEQIFRHVTDEVRYDPYPGALRGSTGALWGKAGNSVDKTLLLAALLAEAAVPYRLAIGTLDEAMVVPVLEAAASVAEDSKRRAADVILPPDVAESWTGSGPWKRAPEIEGYLSDARARVDDTVKLVREALNGAGVALPALDRALPAEERDRHVWLQYADGPTWIDLDPSIPGAEPGVAYATLTENRDQLPDDLFHTVTIRVVSEVVSAGVPTRAELLSHTVRSAEVAGVPAYVVHAPASWIDIAGAITGDQQYRPALIVGDTAVEGELFSLTVGEGALDALGDESDVAEGQTLAEWIEIDVEVPGRSVKQATSSVFDRIPAERRESGDLDLANLPNIDKVHIDDELGDVFLPFAGAFILSIIGQPTPWSYFVDAPDAVAEDTLIKQGAYSYDCLRDLCRLELADTIGGMLFADEPSVTAIHVAPQARTGDDVQLVETRVDILHSHVRLVGLAEPSGGGTGLITGALDHAVERLMMNAMVSLLPAPSELVEVSVGRIFEIATEVGVAPSVLRRGDPVDLPDLLPSAIELISDALDAGHVLVIPERPVDIAGVKRIGWWDFDPVSGTLLDRMDDGGRAAANEYAGIIRIATMAACGFAVLGAIAFVMKAAQGQLNSFTAFFDSLASTGGAIAGCAAGGYALP